MKHHRLTLPITEAKYYYLGCIMLERTVSCDVVASFLLSRSHQNKETLVFSANEADFTVQT